jgi:hypothetical protein
MIFTSNEKRGIYTCARCRLSMTQTVWRRAIEDESLGGKPYCEPCRPAISTQQQEH